MHVYAFGSVCRGEIDLRSDIDLLAVVESVDGRFDPAVFSIYSYVRLRELWGEGNPFAWHLALESRLLFAEDATDFIAGLGSPSPYTQAEADCRKFHRVFADAVNGLATAPGSIVFELSTIFLAIRNIATCFSLARCERPTFGRHAALHLGSWSLPIDCHQYGVLVRARILSTRAVGPGLTDGEINAAESALAGVEVWMERLITEVARE